MNKFILFFALFSAIFLNSALPGGIGGSASDQADYFYMHPFNTNQNGLFQIAENIAKNKMNFFMFLFCLGFRSSDFGPCSSWTFQVSIGCSHF